MSIKLYSYVSKKRPLRLSKCPLFHAQVNRSLLIADQYSFPYQDSLLTPLQRRIPTRYSVFLFHLSKSFHLIQTCLGILPEFSFVRGIMLVNFPLAHVVAIYRLNCPNTLNCFWPTDICRCKNCSHNLLHNCIYYSSPLSL